MRHPRFSTALFPIALLASLASPPTFADLELATKSGCTVCHQGETAVIGPAYKEVAARYKGDAAAVETLVAKVRSGGAGNWGQVPMTPHPHISEEDIRKLVQWVLSL
jgi:cytochrome c